LLKQQDSGLHIRYDDILLSIRKNKADHITNNYHSGKIDVHTEPSKTFYQETIINDRGLERNVLIDPSFMTA